MLRARSPFKPVRRRRLPGTQVLQMVQLGLQCRNGAPSLFHRSPNYPPKERRLRLQVDCELPPLDRLLQRHRKLRHKVVLHQRHDPYLAQPAIGAQMEERQNSRRTIVFSLPTPKVNLGG